MAAPLTATERITLRLRGDMLAAIDHHAQAQGHLDRSEAARDLLIRGLQNAGISLNGHKEEP